MHGNLRDGIWKFERDELKKLFALEARLIELNKQSPVVRPLKGVLMTQLSNFILKSRNNYNEDYICKYLSEDVARESIKIMRFGCVRHKILMMRENKGYSGVI